MVFRKSIAFCDFVRVFPGFFIARPCPFNDRNINQPMFFIGWFSFLFFKPLQLGIAVAVDQRIQLLTRFAKGAFVSRITLITVEVVGVKDGIHGQTATFFGGGPLAPLAP